MTLSASICTGQDRNKTCSQSSDAYVLRKPSIIGCHNTKNALTCGCAGTPANSAGRCYGNTTEKWRNCNGSIGYATSIVEIAPLVLPAICIITISCYSPVNWFQYGSIRHRILCTWVLDSRLRISHMRQQSGQKMQILSYQPQCVSITMLEQFLFW